MLGNGTPLATISWPVPEQDALTADSVTIVVQVNGKVRAKLLLPAGLDEARLKDAALNAPQVKGKISASGGEANIVKIITVPDKLVNIVVKG
jgi:leucyl-tRNA synthetase